MKINTKGEKVNTRRRESGTNLVVQIGTIKCQCKIVKELHLLLSFPIFQILMCIWKEMHYDWNLMACDKLTRVVYTKLESISCIWTNISLSLSTYAECSKFIKITTKIMTSTEIHYLYHKQKINCTNVAQNGNTNYNNNNSSMVPISDCTSCLKYPYFLVQSSWLCIRF